MLLIQLSAAQGPAECQLMVAKTYAVLEAEAIRLGYTLTLAECLAGVEPGTYKSVLLAVDGMGAMAWAHGWAGTLQWMCPSPYRPRYARKNWFIGVHVFLPEADRLMDDSQIRFEAMRASGPGGQHVNKTNSAIRAVHVASGESVKVQSERSQHANKRLAVALLQHKLSQKADAVVAGAAAKRRQAHLAVSRGNPSRVYVGPAFSPVKRP